MKTRKVLFIIKNQLFKNRAMKINCFSVFAKNRLISIYTLLGLFLALQACEDEITPTLDPLEPLVTIDAWLHSKSGEQVIYIQETTSYFDQSEPPARSGAEIVVSDDLGNTFEFNETEPGKYVWGDESSFSFVNTNRIYELEINLDGDVYSAVSEANRSPTVDSIVVEKREEDLGQPAGYYAQFYARDFTGPGDTYWIRSYKNGEYLGKPSEINLAYDAAFSAGGNFDGFTFISPIREGINPNDEDENEEALPPFEPGDVVRVEIWSITNGAFQFLADVADLTNREGGTQALFQSPIFNTKTNILLNGQTTDKVVGYFNTSMVNSLEKTIEEQE